MAYTDLDIPRVGNNQKAGVNVVNNLGAFYQDVPLKDYLGYMSANAATKHVPTTVTVSATGEIMTVGPYTSADTNVVSGYVIKLKPIVFPTFGPVQGFVQVPPIGGNLHVQMHVTTYAVVAQASVYPALGLFLQENFNPQNTSNQLLPVDNFASLPTYEPEYMRSVNYSGQGTIITWGAYFILSDLRPNKFYTISPAFGSVGGAALPLTAQFALYADAAASHASGLQGVFQFSYWWGG